MQKQKNARKVLQGARIIIISHFAYLLNTALRIFIAQDFDCYDLNAGFLRAGAAWDDFICF